jgi:UTP--glucose-1-phosphate uridylyltransferase
MIRKAVIPAAGFGTRFLPATKAQPKEMMPVIDTPVIQLVVEEAIASGLDDIVMITGRGKRAIEDHFDRSVELEMLLEKTGDEKLLRKIQDISELADIHYIRQKKMRGLGDAVLRARMHIDNEPFVILLGDTVLRAEPPCARQLVDLYNRVQRPIIAVEEAPMEKIHRYGVIQGRQVEENLFLIESLVEKPKPEEAPSNLAISSRYLLTPDIFELLEKVPPGKKGEIQLTDALNMLARQQQIFAYKFSGKRHDIGNPLDYLKATVEFALGREDLGEDFRRYLESLNLSKSEEG